jgi:ketosteroid isomerase-like protein
MRMEGMDGYDAEQPARAAAIRSVEAVEAGDRETWLGLFTDDALVQDPIGASPLDPTGEGHRGIEAISSFYDRVVSQAQIRFSVRESYAQGDECANVVTITSTFPDGGRSVVDAVSTYRLAPDGSGKLMWLRAYWEFDALVYEPPTA